MLDPFVGGEFVVVDVGLGLGSFILLYRLNASGQKRRC